MTLAGGTESVRDGRPFRHFPLALSATALALAWSRQEGAPHGAVVVAERELTPRARLGALWTAPPDRSLCCAVVLRPSLTPDHVDLLWLAAGLAAADAAGAVAGSPVSTWWPDVVVTGDEVRAGSVKSDAQLGPGTVRSAVLTVRLDLAAVGVDATRRDDMLDALLASIDALASDLAGNVPPAYQARCALVGRRVKASLLPKGETRGKVSGVDRSGRLVLESPTGLVEYVGVDSLRDLSVVPT